MNLLYIITSIIFTIFIMQFLCQAFNSHAIEEMLKQVLILPSWFFVIIKGVFFDFLITGEIQSSDYLQSN